MTGNCPQFMVEALRGDLGRMKEVVNDCSDILCGRHIDPDASDFINDKDHVKYLGLSAQGNIKACKDMLKVLSSVK